MQPRPATDVFELPFIRYKRVDHVNDALAAAVNKAFSRERTTVRRRIERVDAEILSQYARLLSITDAVARTANLDMVAWFCAALDAPASLCLDSRLPPLFNASETTFAGNWVIREADIDPRPPNGYVSALLADRADIIEFSEALRADILSGQHQFLVLHDVKDVVTQHFIASALSANVSVEILPGHLSLAVFDANESDANRRLTLDNLLEEYVNALTLAPEFLRPRTDKGDNWRNLVGMIKGNLERCFDVAAKINQLVGVESSDAKSSPILSLLVSDVRAQGIELSGALCRLLDSRANPMGALISQDYRDQAQRAHAFFSSAATSNATLVRDQLLNCYEITWKVLNVMISLTHHALASNKTIRLATVPTANGVIVPRPFKPFCEYIFFYRFQEFQYRKFARDIAPVQFKHTEIGTQIDHYIRIWQAVALVELLFMIIRRERPSETIRWLDLGCANGVITNLVRLDDLLPDRNWEIVGVDWNAAMVEMATKRAGPQRTYLVGDVKQALDKVESSGFNIVSAFEFVEHLEDPVATLSQYRSACLDYFVAGSPRCERQGWLPVANHIWTFDRQGFEEILRAAGFTPTFANEALVGSYSVGADWLTVISGQNKKFPHTIKGL